MAESGPRNLITDVPGLLVGQAEDAAGISGTTVVLAEAPAIAAVDVRGGAPGSRETELLDPAALVTRVDAIVLSGGSAFGLDAAAGVMAGLAARGRGFAVREVRVPIVPAAILFDLGFPGRQRWSGEPPYRRLGQEALARAAKDFALGNAGAGLGAKAGRLKGGIGSASLRLAGGVTVGALVAVNSWGSTVRPDCGRLWAAELALAGEIMVQPPPPDAVLDAEDFSACAAPAAGANTTIAVVATDAALDRSGCRRLAIMAQDGLAQAIRPAHTPFDGDTVFALATGLATRAAPAPPAPRAAASTRRCWRGSAAPPRPALPAPSCARSQRPRRWAAFRVGVSAGEAAEADQAALRVFRASCAGGSPTMRDGGKVTLTWVPTPTSLDSCRLPPCNSMIALTSGRPKPVPWWARAKVESTCSNGWSTRSRSSAAMPMPVSLTVSTIPVSGSHRPVTAMCPPAGVNLMALVMRLSNTCLVLRSSARSSGSSSGSSSVSVRPLLPTRVADQLAYRLDRLAQVESILDQIELASLGFRQIEDVVDDLQEMRTAFVDVPDIDPVLLIRQCAEHLAHHHLGKADDRVERCAQFVAHCREEGRFAAVCRLRRLLGDAQCLVGGLTVTQQLHPIETAVEHRDQRIGIARLVEIIIGAAAQRRDRRLAVELSGHQHADQLGLLGLQAGDQVDAGRDATEPDIDQRNRDRLVRLLQRGQSLFGSGDTATFIASRLQEIGQQLGEIEIVVDDQDRAHGHLPSRSPTALFANRHR